MDTSHRHQWLLQIEGLPNLCCHFNVNSHGENMSVIKENEYMFRVLAEGDPKTTRYIIHGADRPLFQCLVYCANNSPDGIFLLG